MVNIKVDSKISKWVSEKKYLFMVEPMIMITKSKLKDLSTLIMQDIWISKNLFMDMCSLCLTHQSVGKQHFRRLLPYQQLKRNIFTSLKL